MRSLHANLVVRLAGRSLPIVEDIPAVLLLPVAVSAQDLDAIIYDCRPPILPVSIRMKALRQNGVVVLAVLPSLAVPPGEVSQECEDSLSEWDAELALMSEFSSNTDTELEDEFCRFQPLPETVSPLGIQRGRLADVAVSLSGADSARGSLCRFRNTGVSDTNPGGALSSNYGCLSDV